MGRNFFLVLRIIRGLTIKKWCISTNVWPFLFFQGFSTTCAMKATKIWEVLNVATVEGGIIVRDLIIQIKPKMPIHPTPKDVAKSFH